MPGIPTSSGTRETQSRNPFLTTLPRGNEGDMRSAGRTGESSSRITSSGGSPGTTAQSEFHPAAMESQSTFHDANELDTLSASHGSNRPSTDNSDFGDASSFISIPIYDTPLDFDFVHESMPPVSTSGGAPLPLHREVSGLYPHRNGVNTPTAHLPSSSSQRTVKQSTIRDSKPSDAALLTDALANNDVGQPAPARRTTVGDARASRPIATDPYKQPQFKRDTAFSSMDSARPSSRPQTPGSASRPASGMGASRSSATLLSNRSSHRNGQNVSALRADGFRSPTRAEMSEQTRASSATTGTPAPAMATSKSDMLDAPTTSTIKPIKRSKQKKSAATGAAAAAGAGAGAAGLSSVNKPDAPTAGAQASQLASDPPKSIKPAKQAPQHANAVPFGEKPVKHVNPLYEDIATNPKKPWYKRFPWLPWLLGALALAVILGVALGVGLGVGLSNNDDNKNLSQKPNSKDDGQSSDSSGHGGKPASVPKDLKPLPKWNWTSTTNKVFGTNLGGLFLLERWMFEDWMVEVGGPDAWDEYSLSEKLGDKLQEPLRQHIDSWFTEDDMNTLQDAGVNMIRIPLGYWPFLSTKLTNEPYQNASHLEKLSDIMYWSWNRSMYVLIDMHGLPGSQNNDQSSGHNYTSNDNQQISEWYSDANQNYSRQMVDNMLGWLDAHPAKSVVAGITTVNEPKVYSKQSYESALRDFYDFSIERLKPHGIPLVAHHAFVDSPYQHWKSYASNKSPDTFIFDDHPYPAWFQTPEPSDKDKMISSICQYKEDMIDFPVPVLYGEFSAINILNDTQWTTDYLKTQLKVFGWSAGSTFFNFRVNRSENPVLASPYAIGGKYSMLEMLQADSEIGHFPSRNTTMPVIEFTNQLSNSCGDDPQIAW